MSGNPFKTQTDNEEWEKQLIRKKNKRFMLDKKGRLEEAKNSFTREEQLHNFEQTQQSEKNDKEEIKKAKKSGC